MRSEKTSVIPAKAGIFTGKHPVIPDKACHSGPKHPVIPDLIRNPLKWLDINNNAKNELSKGVPFDSSFTENIIPHYIQNK
jgi:hypothetical protein